MNIGELETEIEYEIREADKKCDVRLFQIR